MTNTKIEMIKKIVELEEYDYYGFRSDDKNYNVGDNCLNSHQLYGDAIYNEDGELFYPFNKEYDAYDAGELDGTCSIFVNDRFNDVSEFEIQKALESVSEYRGKYIYLIAGNCAEGGEDIGEIIIENSIILAKFNLLIK